MSRSWGSQKKINKLSASRGFELVSKSSWRWRNVKSRHNALVQPLNKFQMLDVAFTVEKAGCFYRGQGCWFIQLKIYKLNPPRRNFKTHGWTFAYGKRTHLLEFNHPPLLLPSLILQTDRNDQRYCRLPVQSAWFAFFLGKPLNHWQKWSAKRRHKPAATPNLVGCRNFAGHQNKPAAI